jgi:hypothetical protein
MKCGHCDTKARKGDRMRRCPTGQPGHDAHAVCVACYMRLTADAPSEPLPAPPVTHD